ncbi:hypothetical protein [Salinisphaera hydrothermalis]|nr:hypothetical protein [Salinisphaera hydrothermalis]
MMLLTVPESLRFYFESASNIEVIDGLVGKLTKGSKTSPDDMGPNDLATFHKALLAAYQTQVDYWQFHKDIWDATWGVAIAAHNHSKQGQLTPCAPHEYAGELSIDYVWDDAFYYMHRFEHKPALKGGTLVTGVWARPRGVKLMCYIEDGVYDLSNGLDLDASLWAADHPDDNRYSVASEPLEGAQTLNYGLLHAAASHALKVISAA